MQKYPAMASLFAHAEIIDQHKTLSGFLLTQKYPAMASLLARAEIIDQHKTLTGFFEDLSRGKACHTGGAGCCRLGYESDFMS